MTAQLFPLINAFLTEPELEELEQLLRGSTQGEWVADDDGSVVAFPHGKQFKSIAEHVAEHKDDPDLDPDAHVMQCITPCQYKFEDQSNEDDCQARFQPEGQGLTPEVLEVLKKEGFTGIDESFASKPPDKDDAKTGRFVLAHQVIVTDGGYYPPRDPDQKFIVAAHNRMGLLLAELRDARAKLDLLRQCGYKFVHGSEGKPIGVAKTVGETPAV